MMIDYPDDGLESLCAEQEALLAPDLVPPQHFSSIFIDYTLDQSFNEFNPPDELIYRFQHYFLSTYQSFENFYQQYKDLFKVEYLSAQGQQTMKRMMFDHYKGDEMRRKRLEVFKELYKNELKPQKNSSKDTISEPILFYEAIRLTSKTQENFILDEMNYWTGMYKTSKYAIELQDEVNIELVEPVFAQIEHDNYIRKDSKKQILNNIKHLSEIIFEENHSI